MNESELVYDSIDLLYYKLNRVRLNKHGSYIDSPKWFKKQKSNNKSKK